MKNKKALFALGVGALLALTSCFGEPEPAETSGNQDATSEVTSEHTSEQPVAHAISILASELVELSADKTSAAAGETVTITATPKNEKVVIDKVLVNGEAVLANASGKYTFTMPDAAVTIGAEAHELLEISLAEYSGLTLSASKLLAEPGDRIDVSVAYDANEIELIGLVAGSISLGELGLEDKGDGLAHANFFFSMPEHNVLVEALFNNGAIFSIVNESEHAHIDVNSARTGDEVLIAPSIDLGYDFDGIEAVIADADGNETPIDLTDNHDGTYSFTMPKGMVTIRIETVAGQFEIVEELSLIYSVEYNDAEDGEEAHWVTSADGFYFYGSEIRVRVHDSDTQKITGLILGSGNTITLPRDEENGDYFYFTMPAHKIELGLETEELLHQIVLNSDGASHLDIEFFRKDENGNYVPTTGFLAYEKCYVKVSVNSAYDEGDYGLQSLMLSYDYHYSYSEPGEYNTENRDLIKPYEYYHIYGLNEDGYYEFDLMYSTGMHMDIEGEHSVVNITAVEKDTTEYKGKPWVGQYLGIEAWGAQLYSEWSSSYSFVIDGAGEFYRGSNYKVFADDNNGTLTVDYVTKTADQAAGMMLYNDKVIVSYYNPNNSNLFSTYGGMDLLLAFKVQPGDSAALYTLRGQVFTIGGSNDKYGAFQVMRDDAIYANVFVDSVTKAIFMDNVEFNMLSGDHVGEADSVYEVLVDGDLKYSIGANAGVRLFLDGVQGTYAASKPVLEGDPIDEGNLVLDGMGNATFDGLDYTYIIDGDNIVLRRSEETEEGSVTHREIFTLDKANGTASHIGSEADLPTVWSVDNVTLDTGLTMFKPGSHVQPNYHFTDNGDGTYTSANKGINSSTAEMTIVAGKAGKLSFHIAGGGENNYDTARIFKNGVAIKDYTTASFEDDVTVVVAANDRVQICYSKDSSTAGSIDQITISNIEFILPDVTAGEYEINGLEDTVVLDGFGHGTYDGKEFEYENNDGTITVVLDLGIVEDNGNTVARIRTFTLNVEGKTGSYEDNDTSMSIGTPVVDLGSTNPWTVNDGVYTSGNASISSSTSTITFTFDADGTFSFHYHQVSEGGYDYATFYLNGTKKTDLAGSGSAEATKDGDYEIEVHAGDTFTITYKKDSSGNKGADNIVLTNVLYLVG